MASPSEPPKRPAPIKLIFFQVHCIVKLKITGGKSEICVTLDNHGRFDGFSAVRIAEAGRKGRRTKFFNGRGVALRRPDGAARRPYQRNEEFCPAAVRQK